MCIRDRSNGTWDGSKVTDTDWADIVTQTGITHEHTISGSGGHETAQAFFSIGYLNNQGTQKGQEYERYTFSMSVDLQVKPWFKMGGSINGSWAVQDYGYSRCLVYTSALCLTFNIQVKIYRSSAFIKEPFYIFFV